MSLSGWEEQCKRKCQVYTKHERRTLSDPSAVKGKDNYETVNKVTLIGIELKIARLYYDKKSNVNGFVEFKPSMDVVRWVVLAQWIWREILRVLARYCRLAWNWKLLDIIMKKEQRKRI